MVIRHGEGGEDPQVSKHWPYYGDITLLGSFMALMANFTTLCILTISAICGKILVKVWKLLGIYCKLVQCESRLALRKPRKNPSLQILSGNPFQGWAAILSPLGLVKCNLVGPDRAYATQIISTPHLQKGLEWKYIIVISYR